MINPAVAVARLVSQRPDARELSVIVLVREGDGVALQTCLESLQRWQLRPGEIRVVTDGAIPGLAEAEHPVIPVHCPPDATTPERFNLACRGSAAACCQLAPLRFEHLNALGA